jgi:FlaA1/EpsC-like NDP-sugar epimerase
VLYEISEFGLFEIERELRGRIEKDGLGTRLVCILGSVDNAVRVKRAINHFKVEVIYHAAAYKHVPMVEHNIFEGVRNNVIGTRVVAEAAAECGVARFVLISTDKAVRPTNVMGATKRFAELILQDLASRDTGTIFSMVRFGNVLGSSGSVVPLFRKQIAEGGPITVTHPEITRYFMTIPEAAQLVIQAGAMAHGGDVFVLDMGQSVKIVDLARRMVQLSGLELKSDASSTKGDIEIVFSGLRPGEKLYEELLIGDNVLGTAHPKILRAQEKRLEPQELQACLAGLADADARYNCKQAKEVLCRAVDEFSPSVELVDWLKAPEQSEKATLHYLKPASGE